MEVSGQLHSVAALPSISIILDGGGGGGAEQICPWWREKDVASISFLTLSSLLMTLYFSVHIRECKFSVKSGQTRSNILYYLFEVLIETRIKETSAEHSSITRMTCI
jgi:hypothetical protein